METTTDPRAEPDSLPELEPSLASIVAPIGVTGFLDRFWKREVFFCPGSPERLGPIARELGDADVGKLLWQSQHYVLLWPPSSPHASGAGRRSLATALEAYEKRGATLYFQMKDGWPLTRWTAALARELGEPPVGVTAFFAVRGGSGTRPHVDWNENFTIQLRGTKRWLVAPNGFVRHPVTNWTVGDPPPLYAHSSELPTEMPADAREYCLTPGSVLYVPRGYFHHVTAVDSSDSLSLSMSLPPTPWAHVLGTLLSLRLLEYPEFREGLTGAFGTGWGREEILRVLPEKVERLRQHAREIESSLVAIMRDPERLNEYLAKRQHPRY
jgi:50S ribosomal protein L16 3-hydroxylase